jgi:hypothetical protein
MTIRLRVGRAYMITGMKNAVWDIPHPRFGSPDQVAAVYLGSLRGVRRWHGFEVWADGSEQGVLFMNDDDMLNLHIAPMNTGGV